MSSSIEHFEGEDKQHYFAVKAANGKTVAQSEGYKTAAGAEKGADALRKAVLADLEANPGEDTVDQLVDAGLIEVVGTTTPEALDAFADTYGYLLHPSAVPSSAHVIARDRTTLRNVLETAAEDGWTIAPPTQEDDGDDE